MSFWLNLIPKLNLPGPSYAGNQEHHLLVNHHEMTSYHGIVRASVQRLNSLSNSHLSNLINQDTNQTPQDSSLQSFDDRKNRPTINGTAKSGFMFAGSFVENDSNNHHLINNSSSVSLFGHDVNYSTALSATIVIGFSLLLLNAIVFAGVFYKRENKKVHHKFTQNHLIEGKDQVTVGHNN